MSATEGHTARHLPDQPSLEFERKRAKKLLRSMRVAAAAPVQLADAHFAIAREYGFASWPRLVEYFTLLERQIKGERNPSWPYATFKDEAHRILGRHDRRDRWTLNAFAATVPRMYGLSLDEVAAMQPTLEEALLVIAREQGFA